MTLNELKEACKQLGMPAFTGGQMAKWLYTQHITSIDEMTNLSKANREKLKAAYTIGRKKQAYRVPLQPFSVPKGSFP